MKLNDTKLRNLTKSGKHADGFGLYLEITEAGGRYWRLKYRFGGKEKRLAFGVYPTVTLKQARERREEARKLLAQGIAPGVAKRDKKLAQALAATNTFEAVAREFGMPNTLAWAPARDAGDCSACRMQSPCLVWRAG
ncbi:Arm DNA-binding domain-containing protein [Xenophilus azovorans]|uniref:Arm DNA-binding domain-containing protein n=1 Tax=Xenophilus azovorans TaxID=151755 RepID=UPI0005713F27|nr:Arm DNA-binding domain-containing protein [Xenophilus azovorans]